jgi:hypothetical protein
MGAPLGAPAATAVSHEPVSVQSAREKERELLGLVAMKKTTTPRKLLLKKTTLKNLESLSVRTGVRAGGRSDQS